MWITKFKLQSEENPDAPGAEGASPAIDSGVESAGNEWETIANEFDIQSDEDGGEAGSPAANEPVVEPKTEPVVAATPTPASVAEAPKPAVEPTVPVQGEPKPEPVAQPQTFTVEEKAQARQQWVDTLTNEYQLSEAEANSFREDPVQALPKLAGQMHARMMENVMQLLGNWLPSVVQQQMMQVEQTKKADEGFFGSWPELKSHRNVVLQQANLWKQANPTKGDDAFIKEVGALAWVAAGLSLADLVAKSTGAASAAASSPAPVAPASQAGYRPTTASAAPQASQTIQDDNPFAQMASAWDLDENES